MKIEQPPARHRPLAGPWGARIGGVLKDICAQNVMEGPQAAGGSSARSGGGTSA